MERNVQQAVPVDVYFKIAGPITERAATVCEERFSKLFLSNSKPNCIHILLWSLGGEAEAGLRLYHLFSRSKIPITIYTTCAKSAGSLLFLGAQHRKITGDCAVMFHEATTKITGRTKIDEIAGALKQTVLYNNRIKFLVKKHMSPVTRAEWAEYASCIGWSPTVARLKRAGLIGKTDVLSDFSCLPDEATMERLWIASEDRCPICFQERIIEHSWCRPPIPT